MTEDRRLRIYLDPSTGLQTASGGLRTHTYYLLVLVSSVQRARPSFLDRRKVPYGVRCRQVRTECSVVRRSDLTRLSALSHGLDAGSVLVPSHPSAPGSLASVTGAEVCTIVGGSGEMYSVLVRGDATA